MDMDLVTAVNKFRKSSAFTPGDAFSFAVKINDTASLPGKFDPRTYLDAIGFVAAKRVAVVCAANGGLCTELLRRGAGEVVAFEPRNQYFKSLAQVASFYSKAHDSSFKVELRLPDAKDGVFDLIIWSEGVDDIRDPIQPLQAMLGALAPAGRMFIEVTHGTHAASPVRVNSWRPSAEAFIETLTKNKNIKPVRAIKGRHSNRQIHEIVNTFSERAPVVTAAPHVDLSPETMAEIATFSDELTAKLLQATSVPKEVLDRTQVPETAAPTPASPADADVALPTEGLPTAAGKPRRPRKTR